MREECLHRLRTLRTPFAATINHRPNYDRHETRPANKYDQLAAWFIIGSAAQQHEIHARVKDDGTHARNRCANGRASGRILRNRESMIRARPNSFIKIL